MVLTYNRANLLKETIDSILNQTIEDFEVIIVDNYSMDSTEQVVKSFTDKRIKYFKNENHGQLSVNRNYAIKKSIGEYIAICDDDDLWLSNKLEKQLSEFDKYKDIGLICTNGYTFNESNEELKIGKSINSKINFKDLLFENIITCSSILVKKNVLDDVGIFDESLEIATVEDYELWLRIAKKYTIKYLGVPLIKYRIHSGALTKTYLKNDKSLKLMRVIYKKLLQKEIIDNTVYRRAIKRSNYQFLIYDILTHKETMNFKKIIKTDTSFWEKLRLVSIYFLYYFGLLDLLRHIHLNRNILHIR